MPAPLLSTRRVVPEHGQISDAEWEVAHTYLAFAFRRLGPNGEAVTRPPPPLRSLGGRRMTDADILWLEGGDGVAPEPTATAAAAAAAPAPASRKRERGHPEAEAGRPTKAANVEGDRPPPNIHTEQDALFD